MGLWAAVHLVSNGGLASAVLFGTFAVVCFAGAVSIDAERKRLLGAGRWEPFAAETAILSFTALGQGRTTLGWRELPDRGLAAAPVLYALVLGGRSHLIGVSPFPS